MSITQSPYYRSGQNVLPSNAPVKPGGLYVADDEGSGVFHLYSTTALPASKSDETLDNSSPGLFIEHHPNLFNVNVDAQNPDHAKIVGHAHHHASGPFEAAPSLVMMVVDVNKQVSNDLKIDPTTVDNTFSVNINGEIGYFYNIPQQGKQLLFKHEAPYPTINTPNLEFKTRAAGQLYFQFQNKVYLCNIKSSSSTFKVKLSNRDEAKHFTGDWLDRFISNPDV